MKKILLYILFLQLTIALSGQNISVKASFDSTRILIGDQINYTVSIEQPSNIRLTIPSFRDTLVKNIEIVSGPQTDSVETSQGRIKIIERYRITSFDSGIYRVAPVYVEVKNSDGLNRFYSDYAVLEVVKYKIAPVDTSAKFYDIIGPYKAPLTLGEILPWLLLAFAAVAGAWFVTGWIRKHRKSNTGEERPIIIEPAHVIAFRELENLKAEELWQKGNFRMYYTRLTEILRQYLENRYNVYSLELTTSETLAALLKTGFKRDAFFEKLKSVLTSADLVKFAKYVPGGEENEAHFTNAWDFVEGTKLVITVPQQPATEHVDKKEKV